MPNNVRPTNVRQAVKTPTMDPSETYLLTSVTGIKAAAAQRAAIGAIIDSPPSPVAMPLPPRNFKKIGQLCPIKANSPDTISAAVVPMKALASNTIKIPFATSRISTKAATFLPPVRKTLDIPVFPLP